MGVGVALHTSPGRKSGDAGPLGETGHDCRIAGPSAPPAFADPLAYVLGTGAVPGSESSLIAFEAALCSASFLFLPQAGEYRRDPI